MKKRWVIIIGIAVAFMQAYLNQLIEINGIVPDIALVYIICVALFLGHEVALIVGASIGLIYDIIFGSYIGLFSMFYVVTGYFIGYYRYNFFYSNIQIALVATVIASILKNLCAILFNTLLFSSFEMFNFKVVFLTMIYNIIVCILIHYFFTKVRMWLNNEG